MPITVLNFNEWSSDTLEDFPLQKQLHYHNLIYKGTKFQVSSSFWLQFKSAFATSKPYQLDYVLFYILQRKIGGLLSLVDVKQR